MSGLFTLRSRIAGAARRSAPAYVLDVIPSERSEPRNLAVVVAVLLFAFAPSSAFAAAPPDPSARAAVADPSVRLYDAGMLLSNTLRPQSLDERPGWTLIPEDTLTHKFSGDIVLLNNRVAVARTMDVYAATSAGWFKRASLSPFAMLWLGKEPVRVLENTLSAVQLELTHKSLSGGTARYGLRLVAGEPLVEVRHGGGIAQYEFRTSARHLVVPEFFGDDMVYPPRAAQPRDPSDVKPRRPAPDEEGDMDRLYQSLEDDPGKITIEKFVVPETVIPTENVLLSLQGKGSSVVVCVWEGAERQVRVGWFMLPGDPARLRLECVQGRRVWLACLEKERLWCEFAVAEGGTPADILRTFTPPFPAKWRASFVGKDGVCESITFEQPPEKAPVPDDWRGPVVIYPIDRSRETPLTTILPMDILRSTLGVGPCQYILDAEGLGGDDPAPPDAVLAWIERLVKKKRAARSAEEISERLDAMLTHLAAARQRIDDYAAFGRQVRHVCREAAKKDAEKEAAEAILGICDRLDHDLARGRAEMKTPGDAARLAREIAALIEKPDAAAAFEAPAKALRAIGHAFDATLARSRMAARRMRAYCRGAKNDLARTVETMADRMLRPSK